jgi:hypothetical protein
MIPPVNGAPGSHQSGGPEACPGDNGWVKPRISPLRYTRPKTFPGTVRGTADPSAALGMTKGKVVAGEKGGCWQKGLFITLSAATTCQIATTLPFVIPRACDFSIFSCFLHIQPVVFQAPDKAVILSEALRRSIANRGLYGAESKDPGDACRQMLLGAFRPQTAPEDKKSQTPSAAEGSAVPRTFPGNVFFDRAWRRGQRPAAKISASSWGATTSSCAYVQSLGCLSVRHLRNWAMWRKRLPCMCS